MAKRALVLGLWLAACGDNGGDETGGSDSSGPGTSGGPVTTGASTPTTGVTADDSDGTVATDATGTSNTTAVDTTDDPTAGDTTDTSTGEPVGPMGTFLAVGDGGRRVRSQDGVTWEGQVGSGLLDADDEMAPPDALRALALGDGYVVAVGGGGNFFNGNSMVMRSTDSGVT